MKVFIIIILSVFMLCGCGQAEEQKPVIDLSGFQTGETTEETVPEITKAEPVMSYEEWLEAQFRFQGLNLEFTTDTLEYTGGETSVEISYCTGDYNANPFWNFGNKDPYEGDIGVFLFLDGQLQPYRTAEETEYGYMHTFTPLAFNQVSTEQLFFIPVTGEPGQALELQVMCIIWPDYFLDQGVQCYQHTSYMSGDTILVSFRAFPGSLYLQQVTDRVLSITREETLLSTEYTEDVYEAKTYLLYTSNGGAVYGVHEITEPVTLRYEIRGNPEGQYGLVVFVDNQPVSVNQEDLIYIQTKDGMRTIIDIQLDLCDYDGSCVVYTILVPRNCLSGGYRTWEQETIPAYYLSSAEELTDLMGWEE